MKSKLIITLTALLMLGGNSAMAQGSYPKGDINEDGVVTIADVVALINIILNGEKTRLNITNPAIGQIIGDDGKNYEPGSVPTGVTAVAVIVYVDDNGQGLALSTSSAKKNWADAKTYVDEFTPFAGGTWRLPTKDEWTIDILNACANSEYKDLDKVWRTATRYGWTTSMYWSSTPGETNDKAWAIWLDLDNEGWVIPQQSDTSNEWRAHACLVF